MSELQASCDPVAGFLSDLGAELTCSPSELSTLRHVKSAAAMARSRRVRRRRLAIRSGVVAATVAMVVSTSGVALAGGLPRPVQTMVADAAQVLPVPLPIPYPPAQPAIEMLGTEETPPAIDEVRSAKAAPTEPSELEPTVSEGTARGGDAGTAAVTEKTRMPAGTDEVDKTPRDGRDGLSTEETHWDSNEEHDSGWDDRQDHDQWGGGPNDSDRRHNDRDRSRDMDRDR